MMQDVSTLNEIQIDALKEVGNIGAGNAATALAQFLGKTIDMSVPNASVVSFNEISTYVGGPTKPVMGILLKLFGDISGRMLLLMPEQTAVKLLRVLVGDSTVTNTAEINDFELSCLKELGNIVSGSFLNAFAKLTSTTVFNSLPSVSFDMAGSLIDGVVSSLAEVSDSVFLIEASLKESNENLQINILLLPESDSLEKILSLIGVKL